MASFRYKALDAVGEPTEGVIEAQNSSDAITSLRNDSLVVISIHAQQEGWGLVSSVRALAGKRPPRLMDKINFFHQLAMMLKGGHTLTEGLVMSAQMAANAPLQTAIFDMLIRIQQGGDSFASALKAQKNLFPAYVPRLLAVGERSGELSLALERVATHLEEESVLKSHYVNSFSYPAVVILVAMAVFLGLSIYIVPEFARLLASDGNLSDLPLVSRIWLSVSEWIVSWGLVAGLAIVAMGVGIVISYQTGATKKELDNIFIRLPLIGTNILNTAMAQMGWTMAVLLKSGLSIVESLEFQARNTSNTNIADSLTRARDAIIEGRSLGYGLRQPHIPPIVQNMCVVGERSGELETAVRVFGDYFQRENENRTKRITAFMEPALILIIGGMVAFIYISFFQALFSINSSLT